MYNIYKNGMILELGIFFIQRLMKLIDFIIMYICRKLYRILNKKKPYSLHLLVI